MTRKKGTTKEKRRRTKKQLEWEKKFEQAEQDLASGKKEVELEKKDEDKSEKIEL